MASSIESRVSELTNICTIIQEKGVYAEYATCIEALSNLLLLEDPAILNEMMLYMSRLSFVKDIHGKYLYCTNGYARVLGRDTVADVVSHYDEDFAWQKETLASVNTVMKQTLSDENIHIMERVATFPDGTERAMRTKLLPIYNERKDIIGVLGVAVEVLQPITAANKVEAVAHSA